MLSILIPVYNFNVVPLVEDLQVQALELGIAFEIICLDDGSQEAYKIPNRALSQIEEVIYQELPQNLGRAKIRNELAKLAVFDYLLFMDCDSKVVRSDYLKKYIDRVEARTLLYGGRVYKDSPPKDKELVFHWKYGRTREQVAVEDRQKQAYHAFQTNNFLVPKSVFMDIRFDEKLVEYGHEDTLFGFELRNRNIPILHLDNPLEHIGLEAVDHFLRKTKKGVKNLLIIYRQNAFIETKLLRVYQKITKLGLRYPLSYILGFFEKQMENHLKSENPNMKVFDLYKLALILREK